MSQSRSSHDFTSYVEISTAQNVQIQYRAASAGDRVLAYLLDISVLIGYGFLLYLLSIAGITEFIPSSIMEYFWMIVFLPFFFYHLLFEVFNNGQSIGKIIMKTKVVMLDGSQPGIGAYILRWLLSIVEFGICSGAIPLLVVILNGKGQRIGDLAAGTVVVSLKQTVTLDDTVAERVNSETYSVVFQQASKLTNDDITIIREVLRTLDTSRSNRDSVMQLAEETASVFTKKLGISHSMNSTVFLDTLIKDYNSIHGKLA